MLDEFHILPTNLWWSFYKNLCISICFPKPKEAVQIIKRGYSSLTIYVNWNVSLSKVSPLNKKRRDQLVPYYYCKRQKKSLLLRLQLVKEVTLVLLIKLGQAEPKPLLSPWSSCIFHNNENADISFQEKTQSVQISRAIKYILVLLLLSLYF